MQTGGMSYEPCFIKPNVAELRPHSASVSTLNIIYYTVYTYLIN